MAMPTPHIRPFRENSGPLHDIPFDSPELDFLFAVLGRNFFADMATSTNAYAALHGGRLWTDTTEKERLCFFGILILTGVNERPQYRDYWSTDPALNCPYISSRISRNRYEQLMKYLHLTDPATEDRADKLGKVRPFLLALQQNFPLLFAPGVSLSLDEAMIKYNGRLRWKQYLPKKPIKWGSSCGCCVTHARATAWPLTCILDARIA